MTRRAAVINATRRRARIPAGGLFRWVVLINGLIFTCGTLVLVMSPATVSWPVKLTEIPVLGVGLAVMLSANALLLRSRLAPLDRLAASMWRVDPPRRSARLHDRGDLQHLITSFNAMLDRLESERTSASAAALAAQETERQRIARELHDEIGQTLTVALLSLKRAVDRAPRRYAGSSRARRKRCGPASMRCVASLGGCARMRSKILACRARCTRCATSSLRRAASASSNTLRRKLTGSGPMSNWSAIGSLKKA